MNAFLVTASCPNGHKQTLTFHSESVDQVGLFAGLLDGTSDAYLYKPGPESVIGKCGVCNSPFRCTIEDEGPVGPQVTHKFT